MTWPPPTSTLAPPDSGGPRTDAETGGTAPNHTSERRSPIGDLLRMVSPAAWVAVVGGALVLLAAAIVVVGNWDAIGRSVRVAGLVVGTTALIVASERLRRAVPTTASVIGHVGTFLTATVGIAAMSLAGFTWPVCLAVGGAVAIVATQMQMPRWPRAAFGAGQVAAISLAATGIGALTGTTGGLLAAIAATGLLAIGAHRRAAALALVAVCSPALAALAEAGIGAGTLARAGLVGERLSWSGPVVGVLAALVLGTIAMQRRNNGLMVTAGLAPLLGAVTGLAAIDGSMVAWLCLPGFVVIAAELTWWILPGDAMRHQIGGAIDLLAAALAVTGVVVAPAIAADFDSTTSAAVPLAVAILGLALATARWRSADRRLTDLGLAALAVHVIAIALALSAAEPLVALVAVVSTIAAGWASRTFAPIAVYAPAAWAVLAITEIAPDASSDMPLAQLGMLAALSGFIIAVRARIAGRNRVSGPIEFIAVVGVVAAAAAEIAHRLPSLTSLIAVAAVAGGFMLAERRFVGWSLGVLPIALAIATLPAALSGEFDTLWIGALAATTALAAAWLQHRSAAAAHGAAAGLVLTGAMTLAGTSVTADQFFLLALVVAVAGTGLALLSGRSTPIDSAAATAGALLLLSSWATTHDSWVSLAWIAVGLQLVLVGVARDRLPLAVVGAPAVFGGLVSLWFTSGWHERLSGWLAPADVRVGDLWMALAATAALVAGFAVRRSNSANSWITFGPAFLIAAIWLLPVQADRSTVWALPLALTIGLVAVAGGAAKRFAGPLAGGIAMTVASAFIALGSDISAVPAWVWFGVGGLVLLFVATAIERSSRDDASLRELVGQWS